MFSTVERLKKKTPSGGIGREEYIEHLVEEFHTTTNVEAQEQVSANLANFAYDPINYSFLKSTSALNVFFECITSANNRLVLHGIAGICNLCLDKYFQGILIKPDNFQNIVNLLSRHDADIVINAITTFYLIFNEQTKDSICKPEILDKIEQLKQSSNIRLKNIATLFIEDCTNKSESNTMPSST